MRVWLALGMGICFHVGSDAAVRTFTLSGVTFADGGTASGTFDLDTVSGAVSNWSIAVAGGDTGTFPPLVYSPSNSTGFYWPAVSPYAPRIQFNLNDSNRQLRLPLLLDPTANCGTIGIALNDALAAECYNCSPYRTYTAGAVTTPAADIATSILVTPPQVQSGDAVTVAVSVVNNGPDAVAGVAVSVPLPASLVTASWTCTVIGTGTCAASGSGSVTDSISLAPGAAAQYTIVATAGVPTGSSETVTATATSSACDDNPGDESATGQFLIANPIPTLDTVGMALLIGLLIVAGSLALRRIPI